MPVQLSFPYLSWCLSQGFLCNAQQFLLAKRYCPLTGNNLDVSLLLNSKKEGASSQPCIIRLDLVLGILFLLLVSQTSWI